MTRGRIVEPETLDGLAESDPRAVRSRRDLRRVNSVMGAPAIMARGLREAIGPGPYRAPLRVLELGCGDGRLMLAVAKRLRPPLASVDLTLLDRQRLVDDATVTAYAAHGWHVRPLPVDVRDWIRQPADRFDAIVTNLFLHHFDEHTLPTVLRGIADRCDAFFACEPRRAAVTLAGSHLIGALLVNAVTREDAVLSVRAGFRDAELSAAWSAAGVAGWTTREAAAGLFSHCFVARRGA